MTAHLIADDSASVTTFDPATTAPGWLALSAALTDEVPVIADREDLLVTVAPGAGQGAPACFLPAHATIELDGTHLGGVDPATATPTASATALATPPRGGYSPTNARTPRTPPGSHHRTRHPARWPPRCCWRSPGSKPRRSAAAPMTGTGYAPRRPT
ncbi:MAG TPA: hypothetical protein VFW21_11435 [Mycobacterium sp.]|nr:hypothetical protein [Mycobacterium sp.]